MLTINIFLQKKLDNITLLCNNGFMKKIENGHRLQVIIESVDYDNLRQICFSEKKSLGEKIREIAKKHLTQLHNNI